MLACALETISRITLEFREGAQIEVVCSETLRTLHPRALNLRPHHGWFDCEDYALCNSILKVEDVLQRAIESINPKRLPRLGFDQLTVDADAAASGANAAFKHVAHA